MDRFTKPPIKSEEIQTPPRPIVTDEQPRRSGEKRGDGGTGGDGGNYGDLHPFIEGLLKTLPKSETNWPIAVRIKWLQAASHVFDLIYSTEEPSDQQGAAFIEITKKTI